MANMNRRKLLSTAGATVPVAIAGCLESTNGNQTPPEDVVRAKIQAFEQGDESKARDLFHGNQSDVWDFDDYGASEKDTIENITLDVTEEDEDSATVLATFEHDVYQGARTEITLRFILQKVDNEWKIWDTEPHSTEEIEPGNVVYRIDEYIHELTDVGRLMYMEVEYTDNERLVNSLVSWGSGDDKEINIVGLPAGYSDDHQSSFTKHYTGDSGTNPLRQVAFTESFQIPEPDPDNPRLEYTSIQNDKVTLEIGLDELNITNARDVSVNRSNRTPYLSTPNTYVRDAPTASIEGDQLQIQHDTNSFGSYSTYEILIETTDDTIEKKVSRPRLETGELNIPNVEFVDHGDYAVVESVTVDINLPSQQLSQYDHSVMITSISSTHERIYTEAYKEEANRVYDSDFIDQPDYDDEPEQIPHARAQVKNSGEQTIQIEDINRKEFEFPLESTELLVTTLIGEVPLNTQIVELTSDDLE